MAFTNSPELVAQAQLALQSDEALQIGPSLAVINSQVASAVAWLSRFFPQAPRAYLSGDGSSFEFTLPPDWVAGVSVLLAVEYRQDGASLSPATSPGREWVTSRVSLYPNAWSPTKLRFNDLRPISGTNNIGLDYTITHVVDASSTTIPVALQGVAEQLLASLAAGIYADTLSTSVGRTIQADSVDQRAIADSWRGIEKRFVERAGQLCDRDFTGPGTYDPGRAQQWGL